MESNSEGPQLCRPFSYAHEGSFPIWLGGGSGWEWAGMVLGCSELAAEAVAHMLRRFREDIDAFLKAQFLYRNGVPFFSAILTCCSAIEYSSRGKKQ